VLSWKKERGELHGRIQELIGSNEKLKHDANKYTTTYKGKYQDYKSKLKKANASIQTLAARVAKYEL
jgi:hypothetical protein